MTTAVRSAPKAKSFTTAFTVDKSPQEVFDAINDVRGWWTGEIIGKSTRVSDEFTFRYQDIHFTKQRVVELAPGRKVVWLVTEANLTFVKDADEWEGTHLVFEIVPKGKKTELRFTHEGLVPDFECYEACSGGWSFYVNQSLKSFITKGKGLEA